MKELIRMWTYTRMIVLVAVSAAVYAAALIPFKGFQIVPGLFEIRPAAALPPLLSLMFGPAGAVGAAFGNLIGDFFGMLGPGSLFGMLGNFLYAYIPYRAWRALDNRELKNLGAAGWIKMICIMVLASASCGVVIGWGVDLLGLVPFKALASLIVINNIVLSTTVSPVLALTLAPMVNRRDMLYSSIMEKNDISKSRLAVPGLVLIGVGIAGALLFGLGILDAGSLLQVIQNNNLMVSIFAAILLIGAALL